MIYLIILYDTLIRSFKKKLDVPFVIYLVKFLYLLYYVFD